jgi:hypothetical protein
VKVSGSSGKRLYSEPNGCRSVKGFGLTPFLKLTFLNLLHIWGVIMDGGFTYSNTCITAGKYRKTRLKLHGYEGF